MKKDNLSMYYLKIAKDALRNGDSLELFRYTSLMSESNSVAYKSQAIFLVGAYYEIYGDSIDDFMRALNIYQSIEKTSPSADLYIALATTALKINPNNFEVALEYIQRAASLEINADVLLAFAYVEMNKNPRDLSSANKYYLLAALKGRMQGVNGFIGTSRELNYSLRMIFGIVYKKIVMPFFVLIMGRKVYRNFRA